jgi:hypothetical protein
MELGALIVEPWSFIRTSNGLGYSNFEAGRRREFFYTREINWAVLCRRQAIRTA